MEGEYKPEVLRALDKMIADPSVSREEFFTREMAGENGLNFEGIRKEINKKTSLGYKLYKTLENMYEGGLLLEFSG